MKITSPSNQRVKFFRSLHHAKGRRETGAFLVEGARLCEDALSVGWPIAAAAYCEELLTPRAALLVDKLRGGPWPCYEMSERAFRAASAEKTPQGVMLAAKIELARPEEVRLTQRDCVCVAWNVTDPGNMGTLMRTADFLGAAALAAVGNCVDMFDPKVVRASAGAVFFLPLLRLEPAELWRWVEASGGVAVATSAEAEAGPNEMPSEGPAFLLVGSEAHGLPEEAFQLADLTAGIPRRGRTESLNVAVAAGILLHALAERLAGAEVNPAKGDDGEE